MISLDGAPEGAEDAILEALDGRGLLGWAEFPTIDIDFEEFSEICNPLFVVLHRHGMGIKCISFEPRD